MDKVKKEIFRVLKLKNRILKNRSEKDIRGSFDSLKIKEINDYIKQICVENNLPIDEFED